MYTLPEFSFDPPPDLGRNRSKYVYVTYKDPQSGEKVGLSVREGGTLHRLIQELNQGKNHAVD